MSSLTLDELRAVLPTATMRRIEAQLGIDKGARSRLASPKGGRRKYGNEPTYVDGRRFDSKAEARRYAELVRLHAAGEVLWFCLQPTFRLPAGIDYRADFIVCRASLTPEFDGPWQVFIEDVKGGKATKTKEYRLKKRLMRDRYGIEIMEVQA
ncbi:MAG TPA: DUF1064 domain-containing protein [Phycisphaerae bacterium]|nr:DUF1064 domain-containing protein [Phycisphaerae bacterium]